MHGSTPFPSDTNAKRGSALIFTLVFLIVTIGLSSNMLRQSSQVARMISHAWENDQAHFLAESGLNLAAYQIENEGLGVPTGLAGNPDFTDWETATNNQYYGTFRAIYEQTELYKYNFQGDGRVRDEALTRHVSVSNAVSNTYADFALWEQNNGGVWFTPGKVVDGKYHSDNAPYVWASSTTEGPEFMGRVTTQAETMISNQGPNSGWEHATYWDGWEFNSFQGSLQDIDFGLIKQWANVMENSGGYNGHVFTGDTEVRFGDHSSGNGGAMFIVNETEFGSDAEREFPIDDNTLVYIEDGKLDVKGGVIDGRVSFFADGDIVFYENTTYKNDPRDDDLPEDERDYPGKSDDAAGWFSGDDIWVDRLHTLGTTDQHIQIFGSWVAVDQMGVYRWFLFPQAAGILEMYGSRAHSANAGHGLFDSRIGTQLMGFTAVQTYDQRFRDEPPPFTPALSTTISVGKSESDDLPWSYKPMYTNL